MKLIRLENRWKDIYMYKIVEVVKLPNTCNKCKERLTFQRYQMLFEPKAFNQIKGYDKPWSIVILDNNLR